MEAVAQITCRHQPLNSLLYHQRPSFSRPISSVSFRIPPQLPASFPSFKASFLSSSFSSSLSVKSSSSPSFPDPVLSSPESSEPQFFQILDRFILSLLKSTLIAAVTGTAFFFARFHLGPVYAASVSAPPTVEAAADDAVSDEEKERTLEEHLQSQPNDVEALRNLMEIKIKNQKVHESINIIERLIELEPDDFEWPLLKSHMHCYSGQFELAKEGFGELLERDPLRVEAYHGLVMVASQVDSSKELEEIEKRMEEPMKKCEKEKKKGDLRDFKLLLAQIRVIEGNYSEALKIYQGLVKEEPRDFRPYLCQGIIYTLLKKKDEADKNFEKYQRLVPKGHPYARYFDDNMIATKLFAQKVENEKSKAGSKS